MSFWNDLEAAARKVAGDVNAEFTAAAREQQVKDAYLALGKLYYQAACLDKEPQGPEFEQLVKKIRVLLAEINDLRGKQQVTAEDADFEK